jgi:hypothetical protein
LCTLPSTIAAVMTIMKNKVVFPADVFILFRPLQMYFNTTSLVNVNDICCQESLVFYTSGTWYQNKTSQEHTFHSGAGDLNILIYLMKLYKQCAVLIFYMIYRRLYYIPTEFTRLYVLHFRFEIAIKYICPIWLIQILLY